VESAPAAGRPLADPAGLGKSLSRLLAPGHFLNLNNAQAAGAQRMMVARAEEARRAFTAWAGRGGEADRPAVLAALDTPYPYAHYLAASALMERGGRTAGAGLVRRLGACPQPRGKGGTSWGLEALGRMTRPLAAPAWRASGGGG